MNTALYSATWFSEPIEPVFFLRGSDKFLKHPIVPNEQCWIDFSMRVYIANIFCGTLTECDGHVHISSPSKNQTIDLGCVSLFHNESGDTNILGRTAFFQRICDLCGFDVTILVADPEQSAFNRVHKLLPYEVRYVDSNVPGERSGQPYVW